MIYQTENFNGAYDYRSGSHKGWHVEEHIHEYSEILFCKEGEGTATVNGRRLCLRAGQFLFLPPNYIHKYEFPRAHVICAVFSNDFIPLFFKELGGRFLLISPMEAKELAPILAALPTLGSGDRLTLCGNLHLICAKALRSVPAAAPARSDGILYQKVVSYLSEHYTEDVSLEKVARLFGYHRKYLSHTLHSLTGIHWSQLLEYYRVNCAKRLLEGDLPLSVTEVALKSGFSAMNTFHRSFKRLTGQTPLAYRRAHGK